jgi:membrane protein involved in colicin uptake
MINWQGPLIGALVAGLAAGGMAWQVRGGIEKAACQSRVADVMKASADLIDKKDGEIGVLQIEVAQARGEVVKVNETTRKQYEELQALLSADQVKRDEAAARVEAAARQAAVNAKDAAAKAQLAREVIQNVADQCARAGVPDDVVRVLNDILGAP